MMNKVVAFLEKHVQWIALGLGFLYLGYMIWAYAVQTPVVVTGIAPTPLTPGEVDQHILDTLVVPLETAMRDPHVQEMPVPNFLDAFKSQMAFSNFTPYALGLVFDSPTLAIQLTPTGKTVIVQDPDINALPALPPAMISGSSTGKSNVQLFTAGAPGAPGAAAGAAPVAPAPPQLTAGGAGLVAVAGGPGVGAPAAGTKDTCWVTVSFSIPHDQLAQSFAAAKIPPWTEHTSMLQIQLYREEALPGGKWSQAVPITAINSQALTPYPDTKTNNLAQQQAYLPWAQAHVSDLLQPVFYQVNKGDPWRAPGQILVTDAPVALPPLDSTQDPPANISQYPQDQRLAYFRAHNKYKQSLRGGGGGRPPSNVAPPGAGAIDRPAGSIGTVIYADDLPPGNAPFGGTPGAPSNPPPPSAGGAPGAIPAPAAPPAPTDLTVLFPIPPGDFDPKVLTGDITGWAHDDTVAPGHTYRYMISYRVKNPIWKTSAAKNNPALRDIFDIQSPPGAWSTPINVASTTNFFVCANSRPGAPTAKLIVYKWQDGTERSKKFDVAPGDIIGGKDGDVDFTTGWTVVDIRFDDPRNPESMTLLVMDPNGILYRRDYNTDQRSGELQTLEGQVSQGAAADQLAGNK